MGNKVGSGKRVMDKRITIRLDGERYAFLDKVAVNQGFTVSQIVRSLVYRYVGDVKRVIKTKD